AEAEGFKEIALAYRNIAKVEKEHEKRYLKLLKNVKEDSVFKREEEVEWICLNCGYVHVGQNAPEKCPACQHPQAYFAVKGDNY
ncbi:MAG: rubrerythrin family protein, partial [Bacteroidales bacterium]|nr:rubrerythrin family protein [Bacteroidales bacterium]